MLVLLELNSIDARVFPMLQFDSNWTEPPHLNILHATAGYKSGSKVFLFIFLFL